MALAVTWRGDRATRLRSVVLAVVVAAITLFICVAVSAALMAGNVNQRASERTFKHAAPGQAADLSGDAVYDSISGEQIFVYLWRIETPGVSVPGLPADAEVGDWFVSPELARRMETEPSLQNRYSDARVLTNDGVGSADELVAVRLAGPSADLQFRYVAEPGDDYIGFDSGVSIGSVVAGAAVVLVAVVGLLRAALGPVSTGLGRRLTLLRLLGASRLWLYQLQAACITVVVAPGAVAVAAGWYVIAPRLEAVPLVDQQVLAGDLGMPAWVAAAAAASTVALTTLVGLSRPYAGAGSRPALEVPTRPGIWRVVPLAGSLALVVVATTLTGTSAAPTLFVAGLIAAALAVPLALPVIIHRLGTRVAEGGSTLALLVGRSLGSNARISARSLTALASLAVLVPAAASYIADARQRDPLPPPSTVQTIFVNGEIEAETLEQLADEAGGVFTDVYALRSSIGDDRPPTWTLVAECGSLERFVMLVSCGPDGIVVEPTAPPTLAAFDAAATEPPDGATFSHRLLITDDGDRAEDVLRYHMVNSDHLKMSVRSMADSEFAESRSVPWILAGIGVGAVAAALALLLSVVTSSLNSAELRLRLAGIGADLPLIRRLAAAESASVVAIVGLGGVAVGTVGAAAFAQVDGSALTYYLPSVVIAAVVMAAAAVSAAASALGVSGASLREVIGASD